MKSYSLIEGVSLNESEYSVLSAQSSEYSIISGSKLHNVIKSVISFDHASDLEKREQPGAEEEAKSVSLDLLAD